MKKIFIITTCEKFLLDTIDSLDTLHSNENFQLATEDINSN